MKKVLIVVLAALMIFALAACSSSGSAESSAPAESSAASESSAADTSASEDSSSSESASGSGEELTIIYLSPSTESQYWQQTGLGVENAVLDLEEEHGVKINYQVVGPAQESESDAYIKAFENAIASAPDGIVTATLTPDATGPVTQQAYEQGIPVNFAGMGIDPEDWGEYYGSHYSTSNEEIGQVAAQAMLDAFEEKGIEPKGTIGIHMSVVVPVLEYRMSAFKEYMAEHAPDLVCLDTLYNENDVNNAQANVENQIATYDDLIGLYGANNISGDGIALAIEAAGIQDKVVGIGVDADDLEVEALEKGTLDAIIVQDPYGTGYNCVLDIWNTLQTGSKPAEQEVLLPPTSITQSNMSEETYAALLDPFILKR